MPRNLSFHLHLPHLTFDRSRDLNLLYAIRVCRDLTNKLAMFFIPLFLYQISVELDWAFFAPLSQLKKTILLLAIYYGLARLVSLLMAIPLAQVVMKIGFGRSFVIANLLFAMYVLCFSFVHQYWWLLIVAALLDGFQINFFWNSYHTILSKNAKRAHLGRDLGMIRFFSTFITMISPAIGGFVIVNFGYQTLYFVGLLIVLISIIFSLLLKFHTVKDKINLQEFLSWARERAFRRLSLSFAGRYINDAVLTIWPLYIFLILKAVDKVGFLYTVSLFIAMLLSYFVGSFVDHHKNKKPYFFSGGFLSILWFLRTQIVSIWSIAVVDSLEKLTGNFHWLFFDRLWIMRAKGKEPLSYFVYREIVLSVTAVVFWILFATVFLVLSDAWDTIFIFASMGVLLTLLVKEKKE